MTRSSARPGERVPGTPAPAPVAAPAPPARASRLWLLVLGICAGAMTALVLYELVCALGLAFRSREPNTRPATSARQVHAVLPQDRGQPLPGFLGRGPRAAT
jgi:hypothetical protein